jgi:hypothetical protein
MEALLYLHGTSIVYNPSYTILYMKDGLGMNVSFVYSNN